MSDDSPDKGRTRRGRSPGPMDGLLRLVPLGKRVPASPSSRKLRLKSAVGAVAGKPPLTPQARLTRSPGRKAGRARRVLMVIVLELDESRLESVLDMIDSHALERDVVPVILTDFPRFEVFRRRHLAFEYLPSRSAQARFASDLSWPLYIRRRVALLQAKWRPIGVVSFGSRAPLHNAVEFTETLEAGDGKAG